jgi:uncharacterized protein
MLERRGRQIYCSAFILDVIQFITYSMIEFDWDEAKRRTNVSKHGLDFADAVEFDWSGAVIIPDDRFDYGEKRLLAFSTFRGRVYSIAYVKRAEVRRLISFRRANEREIGRYEAEKARS